MNETPIQISQYSEEEIKISNKEREELGAFYELEYMYPHFVGVGQDFVSRLNGRTMFRDPKVNLVMLQSLIAGWIHAQPWFHRMCDAIPHDPQEIFEVVNDKSLEAACDASRGKNGFEQDEPRTRLLPRGRKSQAALAV